MARKKTRRGTADKRDTAIIKRRLAENRREANSLLRETKKRMGVPLFSKRKKLGGRFI